MSLGFYVMGGYEIFGQGLSPIAALPFFIKRMMILDLGVDDA
jgi:hypothetical protein